MRYTLAQLKKFYYQNQTLTETLDLSEFIPKEDDVLKIRKTDVSFKVVVEQDTYYHIDLHIKTTLVVACAITLDPVEFPLDFHVTETFTEKKDDEYRQVDGITVDLLPIIWSNIYLEKPLRVVKENASFESSETSSKPRINPSFKDLEKFKR